jgi:carboxymethylenebutenolidase
VSVLQTETIPLDVADGSAMSAYVSRPSTDGKHPAILVFMEALGVNSQIRGVADRYAREGFVAIAPDLFHRTRPGYEAAAIVMDEIMPMINSMTAEGMIADVSAAHAWLSKQSDVAPNSIAAVGFCLGGRAAFLANAELPLAAAISYYGGRIAPALLDYARRLHAPHLFFWGGIDAGIPPEQRRTVVDALRSAGKKFVDVEFSDANHAFFNEQVDRYNAPAARQSWALSLAFLNENLDAATQNRVASQG